MKKRLTRSTSDKMIEGVCGGLAEYFDIDATIVRLIFAAGLVFGFGSFGVLYLLMWAIVPKADSVETEPKAVMEAGVQEVAEKGRQAVEEVKKKVSGQEE
jgi:phage shock protein C